MGLLSKLRGVKKRPPKPYVDAGMQLTQTLIQSLRLEGWQDFRPLYTRQEAKAIDDALSSFQRTANDVFGSEVRFHPELAEPLQRSTAAQALQDLAGGGWTFTDKSKLPGDWKARVSTYLKAWACNLDPTALNEMAELLVHAGYKTEAKAAWKAVLLFPTYSDVFFGGADNGELTNVIVQTAIEGLSGL